jgi:hypothetical protein
MGRAPSGRPPSFPIVPLPREIPRCGRRSRPEGQLHGSGCGERIGRPRDPEDEARGKAISTLAGGLTKAPRQQQGVIRTLSG